MSACLSELALDDLILNGAGEAPPHLRTCEACLRRHADHQASVERFEREQATPFWKELRRRYERGRRRRRLFAFGLPGVLVAASLTFVVVRKEGGLTGSYVGAKGAASLGLHCRRTGNTFALGAHDPVQAGDELRFVPRPASPAARYVQIASIDGTGHYAPFYPADRGAFSLPLPAPGEPLAGSIRLDGAPGPERLFFVFSSSPLAVPDVEQAARAAGAHAVDNIAGAPVESGWLVLAKVPAPTGTP
jgi:hypothetical protein